jgi:hypothetical protein
MCKDFRQTIGDEHVFRMVENNVCPTKNFLLGFGFKEYDGLIFETVAFRTGNPPE